VIEILHVFSRVERSETSEKKQKFLSRVEDHPGLSQQCM
jgi:hypothetical protein